MQKLPDTRGVVEEAKHTEDEDVGEKGHNIKD